MYRSSAQARAPKLEYNEYKEPATSKRKRTTYKEEELDDEELAQAYEDQEDGYEKVTAKRSRKKKEPEEKRLRRFRNHAPNSYLERLQRVRTQRMFLIDRERQMSEDGSYEIETFQLAGSIGNIYEIIIDKIPSCNCPDANKGNQCKHIVYIMVNVLKAPSSLAYQLALLSSELELLFANSPSTPQSSSKDGIAPEDRNRKPIEGDCPVCVMEMEPNEAIVWCKAACGNNIHKQCQQRWAASKPGQAKCVYCRTPWQENVPDEADVKRLVKSGAGATVGRDGYVNVAGALGLSGVRDTSTYYHGQYSQSRRYS